MNQPRHSFRLNVGFLIHQSVGSSRDFYFDLPSLSIEPDHNLRNLQGKARISRTPQGLLVQAEVLALIQSQCGRCLTSTELQLQADFTELYAFSLRSTSDSELILPEDGFIDLGPLVREYLVLEIPMNPLCRPDCIGICAMCGEPQGEHFHIHEVESVDPRLAVLKDMLNNQNME
ncbi:MAG: DUF177 domain-containing protein [Anaerolineales bacterium]|nr:DUF177 domain-containing protein [Anaerolineales bacterium]